MKRLANVLIPLPKRIEQGDKSFKVADFAGKVKIALGCECELAESAKEWIAKRLFDYNLITVSDEDGLYTITISVDESLEGMDTEEGYVIKSHEGGAELIGKGTSGAFYAAVTFADMLENLNGCVEVPEAEIFDFPDFPQRSEMMECRWGAEFMEKEDYFKAIDYFASLKHNRVLIEIYSCWGGQFDEPTAGALLVEVPGYPNVKKYHKKNAVNVGKYYSKPRAFRYENR